MRRIALLVFAVGVLVACQGQRNSGAASEGASPRATVEATGQPAVGSMRHSTAFSGHPDRGTLFAYSDAPPVRRGGALLRPVQVSEAHALRAVAQGGMMIQAPSGKPVQLDYVRHSEGNDGSWTFVGKPAGAKPGDTAVITFGEKAVFGTIPDGDGGMLELVTSGGRAWLVEAAGSASVQVTADHKEPDYLAAPSASSADATNEQATSLRSRSTPRIASSGALAAQASHNTIDVVLGYTPTFAARLGGTSQAVTRLTSMVETANTALAESQVDAQFRLVGTVLVNYPDTTSNRSTLFQLTGVACTSSAGGELPDGGVTCTPAERPDALQPLADAREELGADLVALVRTFQAPENGSCGIGWLIGHGQSAIDASDAAFGYAVVSDTSGNAFPDPEGGTCRNDNLAHELGHTLGLQHDREVAANADNDGVLEPQEFGAFPYAFGYVAAPDAGNFFDVMALRRSGLSARMVYSNPDIACGNFPCGVPNQADSARALRQTIPLVAAFRQPVGEVRNDFDGDGRSDILWRNGTTGANAIWRSANSASPLPISAVATSWRVAGTGDFDGDGQSDVLWRNSASGANAIWRSGNFQASMAVATVSNLSFVVAGVGDFNGDGRADIFWRNNATGANAIWLSGNAVTTQPIVALATVWKVAGVGDFDGDGRADVLWRNSSTGVNAIWRSGNLATSQAVATVANLSFNVVGVADFDGDGRADILWRNASTGANAIWRSANAATPQAVAAVANAAWRVAGTGDYDGDGISDILWRNVNTGANAIWRRANAATPQAVTAVTNVAWMAFG